MLVEDLRCIIGLIGRVGTINGLCAGRKQYDVVVLHQSVFQSNTASVSLSRSQGLQNIEGRLGN
jgi:hypothetical protein